MSFLLSLILSLNTAAYASAWQGVTYIASSGALVYVKPSEDAKVTHSVNAGDLVSVGSVAPNNFRSVKFKIDGKVYHGYILGRELANWELKSAASLMRKKKAVYISLVESFQRQGKRDLQTSSESFYNVTVFTGLSTYLAAGIDFPYGEEWAIRMGLVMRHTHMEGDAAPDDNPSQKYKFRLEQEFIGAEAGLRFRPKYWGAWSFMGSAEFSKGTKVTLKVLEGSVINNGEIELPYFMVFSGSILYDYKISKNLAFEPAFRLGVVATAKPVVLLAEGLLTLQYYF